MKIVLYIVYCIFTAAYSRRRVIKKKKKKWKSDLLSIGSRLDTCATSYIRLNSQEEKEEEEEEEEQKKKCSLFDTIITPDSEGNKYSWINEDSLTLSENYFLSFWLLLVRNFKNQLHRGLLFSFFASFISVSYRIFKSGALFSSLSNRTFCKG